MTVLFSTTILIADKTLTRNEFNLLLTLVSPDKQERIKCFRSLKDANNCLLGDILVRFEICRATGLSNMQLEFTKNEHGKPEMLPVFNSPAIHFNISHSGHYVTTVIDNAPAGIDIECIKPFNEKITRRFFSSDEAAYIEASQDEKTSVRRFFEIWTKKEALIKKEGKGLSMPMTSFSVLNPDVIASQNTYFHQIYDDNDTICHVCSSKKDGPVIKVVDNIDIFLQECYDLLR